MLGSQVFHYQTFAMKKGMFVVNQYLTQVRQRLKNLSQTLTNLFPCPLQWRLITFKPLRPLLHHISFIYEDLY